jgi:hypothetical protein
MADTRLAPADSIGNSAGTHFFIFDKDLYDSEGNRVTQNTAEAGLPVGAFLHVAPSYIMFAQLRKSATVSAGISLGRQRVQPS